MSFTPNPALLPDRGSLPLKKRDQWPSSPPPPQQQCDAATFKAPYPYRSRHSGPFQPVPRRVPALYQPWMQTHTPTRSRPHLLSAFREHHGWPEWREFSPLQAGWDYSVHYQHRGPPALHLCPPHHPSRFSPVSAEGLQGVGGGHAWEQLKTFRDRSSERQSNGRNKGPYVRRRDRRAEYSPRVEKTSPPSPSTRLPHPPPEDPTQQYDLAYKSTRAVKHPHSFGRVSPDKDSGSTHTSTSSSTSSTSSNSFPWLLPHFVAGSLIELRDGRLRRVEHLQTEDFLLGSLACPDLRLSCCTVQSISPPASSSSTSRLIILLHDQQSQELVDVYVEYPFFVRGRGWSSCSPQRTARLCGLQCRQLSVGDVCLALTPVSAPPPAPPGAQEPEPSPRKSEGGCESPKAPQPQPQAPPGPEEPAGGQGRGAEAARRRHYSAPELRAAGTTCM